MNKEKFATLLRQFRRDNNDITQEETAQFLRECGISVQYRTYQSWESENPDISSMPRGKKLTNVLMAIEHYPRRISLGPEVSEDMIMEKEQGEDDGLYWSYAADPLLKTGITAVMKGMAAAVKTFWQPWTMPTVETSDSKPSDSPQKERTEPMDYASGVAIEKILIRALNTANHPLSGGFVYHQEEFGLRDFPNAKGNWNDELIVFVDPVDFTFAAIRGLDGSVLISFFHKRHGILATVVGDLFRNRIYWRKKGDNPVGSSVKFNQDPMNLLPKENHGEIELNLYEYVSLKPRRKKKLHQVAINIYTGRPERLLSAARFAKDLLEKSEAIGQVFSVGGALGPLRVAEGLWDVSLECHKGFRFWDLIPGNYIASYNATVTDLEGNKLDFDSLPNLPLDELDTFRQKFICAATPELAYQVLELLQKDL